MVVAKHIHPDQVDCLCQNRSCLQSYSTNKSNVVVHQLLGTALHTKLREEFKEEVPNPGDLGIVNRQKCGQ